MLVRLISLTTPFSNNTLKMALPIVLSISRELQQTCCARAMAQGVPVSQHSLCRSEHAGLGEFLFLLALVEGLEHCPGRNGANQAKSKDLIPHGLVLMRR